MGVVPARYDAHRRYLPLHQFAPFARISPNFPEFQGGPIVAAPYTQPRGAQVAAQPLGARPWFKTSQRVLGRDWPVAYLFVLPTILLLFGLVGYPFVRGLVLSFFNAVGIRTGNFVGLDNYINLWADDFFLRALWTTAQFTFWSVV